MAVQLFELFEHNKALLSISVVDINGDVVNLSNMAVSFYVHDRKEEDDGTNLIEKTEANGVTVTDGPNGAITVALVDTDLVIDETVEDHIMADWQVRYENSAGDDDTDLLTLPQPFVLRRNRVQAG